MDRSVVQPVLVILAVLIAGCGRAVPSVAAGRELYQAHGCGSCHGPLGHGDGPIAGNLPSKPIDFRDASAFKGGSSEAAVADTLVDDPSMPKFDHLTEIERRSIALYVVSMQTNPGYL